MVSYGCKLGEASSSLVVTDNVSMWLLRIRIEVNRPACACACACAKKSIEFKNSRWAGHPHERKGAKDVPPLVF